MSHVSEAVDANGGPVAPSGSADAVSRLAGADRPAQQPRWRWLRRLNWLGLVSALVFFALAWTPSLLPRPPLYLGFIAGAAAAIGYGIGTGLSAILRWAGISEPGTKAKWWAWRALLIGGPIAYVVAMILGGVEQVHVQQLVGEEPQPVGLVFPAVLAPAITLVLLVIARGLRRGSGFAGRQIARVLPPRIATVLGGVVVALLVYWLAAGLLFDALIRAADSIYAGANTTTPDGAIRPTVATRSGGPDSLAAWDTLGKQGRLFVGTEPSKDSISAYTGQPALDPIRVYVGLDSAPTARDRAALAVRELERTGGFDRKVLVVAGATGTGWIEPQAPNSLEYMWGGDTAFVTSQYSFLPSWISFLVDKDRATDAGRELFDAVYAKWSTRPAASRPKLIAYGLSLGSFAIQAGFGSATDLATRTDGALLIGTPNFAQPWATITADRDAGSPQWQPVVRDGRTVRFASATADLATPRGPWATPRILYLQHASDPVVWWSADLMTRQPDWLTEPRGLDVSSNTRWIPFVTFLQVTVDQFFGVTVPVGHGHNYANALVASWAAVTNPLAWTDAGTERLQQRIDDEVVPSD